MGVGPKYEGGSGAQKCTKNGPTIFSHCRFRFFPQSPSALYMPPHASLSAPTRQNGAGEGAHLTGRVWRRCTRTTSVQRWELWVLDVLHKPLQDPQLHEPFGHGGLHLGLRRRGWAWGWRRG